jgi:hypothetical protein
VFLRKERPLHISNSNENHLRFITEKISGEVGTSEASDSDIRTFLVRNLSDQLKLVFTFDGAFGWIPLAKQFDSLSNRADTNEFVTQDFSAVLVSRYWSQRSSKLRRNVKQPIFKESLLSRDSQKHILTNRHGLASHLSIVAGRKSPKRETPIVPERRTLPENLRRSYFLLT